ncbi:MAG: hypothetical protein IPP41_09925 [Rhodocyclaceae bacterium]|nr:hypothetical protein [Rhodocyclaceae bacterium]
MAALPIPALAAINHVLGQADWAREKLAVFAGRSARVVMPPFDANIVVLDNGFLSSPTDDKAEADVTINLPASAPLLLLQGLPVLMRAVKLSGSVDFAEALSFVIRNLKWDVEEDLSKVVGDIAAHRLVDGAKRFGTWNAGAAQNLAGNFAEYFTEENPLIAQRVAVSDFSREVDSLRDDVARLEKRVARVGRAARIPPQV